jgi:hypothetical protein
MQKPLEEEETDVNNNVLHSDGDMSRYFTEKDTNPV